MTSKSKETQIPAYALYGEESEFPDILHCERIIDRAEKHDWEIAPHRHLSLCQFFLLTAGQAKMTLDGKVLTLEPMSIIAVPSHSVHGFVFERHTEGYVLSIPAQDVASLIQADGILANIFQLAQKIPATQALLSVLETINHEQHAAHFARTTLLKGLIIQFASYLTAQAETTKTLLNPTHNKVTEFEKLARENYIKRWRVADYAKTLGVSTTHLNRLCQKVLGQSPQAYVNDLTIHEAKRLLAYTKLDVASIGYRIGFEDPSYFSRVFTRITGMSPRSFRLQYS